MSQKLRTMYETVMQMDYFNHAKMLVNFYESNLKEISLFDFPRKHK